MKSFEEIRIENRRELLNQIDYTRDIPDSEIMELIDERVLKAGRKYGLTLQQKSRLRKELFASIRQLDVLEEFLSDNTVTEIMVNGPDHIFIEREGRLVEQAIHFESKENFQMLYSRLLQELTGL